MGAGRASGDVQPLRIAAEALRVPVDPGDGAADLVGNRHQVAVGLQHIAEIDREVVGARIGEQIGEDRVIPGGAAAPCAAMDEHIDRRIGLLGRIKVESLDRGLSVRQPFRRAQAGTHGLAVGAIAFVHQLLIGRIDGLIVGVVEFFLVEVEPDERTFLARGRLRGRRHDARPYRAHRRAGQQCTTVDVMVIGMVSHGRPPRIMERLTQSRCGVPGW